MDFRNNVLFAAMMALAEEYDENNTKNSEKIPSMWLILTPMSW